MGSVTAREIAFAILTFGIVFSSNENATRLMKSQSEPVIPSAPAEQYSIVHLVDIDVEPMVRRLPVVNGASEPIHDVLSANVFWDIVQSRKQLAKNELRIASLLEVADGPAGASLSSSECRSMKGKSVSPICSAGSRSESR